MKASLAVFALGHGPGFARSLLASILAQEELAGQVAVLQGHHTIAAFIIRTASRTHRRKTPHGPAMTHGLARWSAELHRTALLVILAGWRALNSPVCVETANERATLKVAFFSGCTHLTCFTSDRPPRRA